MNRRYFIESALGAFAMISLSGFRTETSHLSSSSKMPVLFIGHGSPMNAIEDNEFSRSWKKAASALPRPQAILCISAHWQTKGTLVTVMEKPRTIHDFYGFPQELFNKQYPAPGAPALAKETSQLFTNTKIGLDQEWGLDHGAWSVMAQMFPLAEVPVYQLSLDYSISPAEHYALAKQLSVLRTKGVLIVSSGNIVHNLGKINWQGGAFDWAVEFDQKAKQLIDKHDHASLIGYDRLGPAAQLSVPTNEHYLPLLYTLALQGKDEQHGYFADQLVYGSISMRSIRIG